MGYYIDSRRLKLAAFLLVLAAVSGTAIIYRNKFVGADQLPVLDPSPSAEAPPFFASAEFTIGAGTSTPPVFIGAAYYIDPERGDNANAGTSPDAPWRNPPGTRTIDNSSFYSAAWGAVNESNKIQCGQTILLKGGAAQTATQGGGWRIDNVFYASACPAGAPITLRVAASGEWPGSVGPFTVDGTGITATCTAFCTDTHGLVHIGDVATVTLAGAGPGQRLVIRNARAGGITAHNLLIASSSGSPQGTTRFTGDWLELTGAAADGVGIGPAQNFVIRNTISHDNGRSGFSTGNLSDNRVTNGGFQDVEAYGNGITAANTVGDQFLFVGCESCYVVRAKSHNSYLRGLNFGNVGPFGGTDMFLLIRDGEFWDNGLSSDNHGVYQSGPCWSGDDGIGGQQQRGVMQRTIIYRNREAGGPCAYGQGWAEVWNSVWFGNGWDKSVNGTGDIAFAAHGDVAHFGVYNSIVQKRSYNVPWTGWGPSGFIGTKCPVSDYNLYVPAFSDGEILADFGCSGVNAFRQQAHTFANPPGFMGVHDLIGAAYAPGFALVSDTAYAKNNFLIASGSSAIDNGTYMMHTSAAGAGTIIPVIGNGGSSDPRHYFIDGSSYYQATPDVIQIKGVTCGPSGDLGSAERARIMAMTANAIMLDRTCQWPAGAGVHFPWTGNAPDRGAFEAGL